MAKADGKVDAWETHAAEAQVYCQGGDDVDEPVDGVETRNAAYDYMTA